MSLRMPCYYCFFKRFPFPWTQTFATSHASPAVMQQRCIFSGGHILSFSLSTLFSTLHPLQLGGLQLCTSQDQRLPLLAKSICVAIESLPNLLFSSPSPQIWVCVHPRFTSAPTTCRQTPQPFCGGSASLDGDEIETGRRLSRENRGITEATVFLMLKM